MPWSGGSRVYYDNLYRRLSDQYNLRVRVETSHCDGDIQFDAKVSSESLNIHRRGVRLPDWKVSRVPLLMRKVMHISRVAGKCSPAAIHCGDLFPQDFAGMLLRRLGGVPFLVYVHGDELSQTQHRRLQPPCQLPQHRGCLGQPRYRPGESHRGGRRALLQRLVRDRRATPGLLRGCAVPLRRARQLCPLQPGPV